MKTHSITRSLIISILMLNSPIAMSGGIVDIEYMPNSGGYKNTFGLGFYKFNDDGFGGYANFLTYLGKDEPLYDTLTISSFGDPVRERYTDLTIGNIGITKKLFNNLGLYAGIGYASGTGIARKYDPLQILGSGGTYYVYDPANDHSGVNLNAGVILMLEKLALNIGYQSFTKTAYIGIGASF